MSDCGLFALVPNKITSFTSSVAEPDPTRVMPGGAVGEVAWVSGTTYTINARVIRTQTHKTYRDTTGGASTVAPENDPVRWFAESPTNQWAWADAQASTATVSPSPFTITVQPGAATDIEFFNLANVDLVTVTMRSTPGGDVVYENTVTTEEYAGADPHWALYFLGPTQGSTISLSGLPVYPSGEVTITLSSYNGGSIGVGLIAFGSYTNLGVSQFGFESVNRDFGFTTVDKWGNSVRTPGAKGRDLRGEAVVDVFDANAISKTVESLLDVGAVYVPSKLPQYRWLKTWGVMKPSIIQAAGPTHAILQVEIEGNI